MCPSRPLSCPRWHLLPLEMPASCRVPFRLEVPTIKIEGTNPLQSNIEAHLGLQLSSQTLAFCFHVSSWQCHSRMQCPAEKLYLQPDLGSARHNMRHLWTTTVVEQRSKVSVVAASSISVLAQQSSVYQIPHSVTSSFSTCWGKCL